VDPADITATLGIKPIRCWRAGEPRCTPKGNPLEGTWPQTFWSATLAMVNGPKRRWKTRWAGSSLRSHLKSQQRP